jgi:hypothetical protein
MPLPTIFPCCRSHDLFAPIEEHPMHIQQVPGDEVYWFDWESTFHGKATIRVARLGDQAVVSRIYRPTRFGKARRFHRHDDWTRLEDAVVAADFRMLDERGGRHANIQTGPPIRDRSPRTRQINDGFDRHSIV